MKLDHYLLLRKVTRHLWRLRPRIVWRQIKSTLFRVHHGSFLPPEKKVTDNPPTFVTVRVLRRAWFWGLIGPAVETRTSVDSYPLGIEAALAAYEADDPDSVDLSQYLSNAGAEAPVNCDPQQPKDL